MAQVIELYKKCPQCNGTGVHQASTGPNADGPITCNWPGCTDGYILFAKMTLDPGLDDVMDKCNDILEQLSS